MALALSQPSKDLQYNVDACIRAEASHEEHDIADPAIKEYKKVMNEEYAINCTLKRLLEASRICQEILVLLVE